MEHFCVYCGKKLPTIKWKYCGHQCKAEFLKAKFKQENPTLLRGNSSSTTGAISELRVAVDLMAKGFDVFRALSPACPCDIVVAKNNTLLRIQVRTSYISVSGKMYKHASKRDNPDDIDLYAWVLPNEILYEPSLDTLVSP